MSKIIQAPEVKDEFLQCWLQCNNVKLNQLPTRPGRNKVSGGGEKIFKENRDSRNGFNISSIKIFGGERNYIQRETEIQGTDSI